MKRSNIYKIAAILVLVVVALVAMAVRIYTVRLPDDHVGTVLITGSNSGMGLRFARQYADKGWEVIATHRRNTIPETLKSLSSQYDNVVVERMDVLVCNQTNL